MKNVKIEGATVISCPGITVAWMLRLLSAGDITVGGLTVLFVLLGTNDLALGDSCQMLLSKMDLLARMVTELNPGIQVVYHLPLPRCDVVNKKVKLVANWITRYGINFFVLRQYSLVTSFNSRVNHVGVYMLLMVSILVSLVAPFLQIV